jgi:hypothetical protein
MSFFLMLTLFAVALPFFVAAMLYINHPTGKYNLDKRGYTLKSALLAFLSVLIAAPFVGVWLYLYVGNYL